MSLKFQEVLFAFTATVTSEHSIDLYKSIALSVFAALSVEPVVVSFSTLSDVGFIY